MRTFFVARITSPAMCSSGVIRRLSPLGAAIALMAAISVPGLGGITAVAITCTDQSCASKLDITSASADPNPGNVGANVTLHIVVTEDGGLLDSGGTSFPSDLTVVLPSGGTIVNDSFGGGPVATIESDPTQPPVNQYGCSQGANLFACDIPTMHAGWTIQVQGTVHLPLDKDSIPVTVTVDANNDMPGLFGPPVTFDIGISHPDLQAQFFDPNNPPSQVSSGTAFTYIATFQNLGPGDSPNPVQARIDLPVDGLSGADVNSTTNGSCVYHHPTLIDHSRSVTCTFDPMPAGSQVVVDIGAVASGNAGTYQATATIDTGNNQGDNDGADNFATRDVTVVKDTTPPDVTGTPDRPADSNGWYNHPLTVSWSGSDPDDANGPPTCDSPVTYAGPDGGGLSVNGNCTDTNGNVGSGSFAFSYDATAPSITFAGRTQPNPAGWNNSNVTLNWNCADATSGPSGPTVSQTITSEGANQSATGTCTDIAGNAASDGEGGVNIDKTPPTITFVGRTAPNGAGWNNSDVTLTWSCADSLSGPVSATVAVTVTSEGANQAATGTCSDNAGNTASDTEGDINIDKTPPTITYVGRTAANGAGWNNTNVTLNWTCADGLSGPVSVSISRTITTEGVTQSATGTCIDRAGNAASDTQDGVNIDKTPPTVTITSPVNGSYLLNQSVPSSYVCGDKLSGVATCVGTVPSGVAIDTGSVGVKTFAVNATDVAGNSSGASVAYDVTYQICVLYSQSATHQAGSTVPIKLELCDANQTNVSSSQLTVKAIALAKLSTSTTGVPAASGNANPDNDFRFDSGLGTGGGYIYNLSTKGLTTGIYMLTFSVTGDPVVHSVSFQIS